MFKYSKYKATYKMNNNNNNKILEKFGLMYENLMYKTNNSLLTHSLAI